MSETNGGLVGRTLANVQGEVFHFSGKVFDETPLAVSLEFDGGLRVTIEGAEDSESLAVSDRPLEAAEMDESGRAEVEDLSADPLWARVLGKTLTGVADIRDTALDVVAGMGLTFGAQRIAIVNRNGDLFVISDITEDPDLTWVD